MLTIVFEITLSGNDTSPRIIVLAKETDEEWNVINEGY
jgi:uncharacterized protein YrzB (UPF0473 family)